MKHSELRHQPRHVNPRIQVVRDNDAAASFNLIFFILDIFALILKSFLGIFPDKTYFSVIHTKVCYIHFL